MEFLAKLENSIVDIQNGVNPKHFDYELREELKQRTQTHLVFKKYCDYQKYLLFTRILESDREQEIE